MNTCQCTVDWILFDFGGVIAEEGFRKGLKAIAVDNGHDPERFFQTGKELVYSTGYVTGRASEADFWNALRERFPVNATNEALREAVLSRFVLRPHMLTTVRELRRHGQRVGILSDQVNWLDMLEEQHRFFHLFDKVFNSYHLGKSKQDASIFLDVARVLKTPPGRILFVDDSRDNLKRAGEQGYHVLHMGNAEQFSRAFRSFCPCIPQGDGPMIT